MARPAYCLDVCSVVCGDSVIVHMALGGVVGTAILLPTLALVYYTVAAEKAFRKELNRYVSTLSHRITQAGNEVLQQLPIGILLYNEEKIVEWHNPFVGQMLDRDSIIGEPLLELIPVLEEQEGEGSRGVKLSWATKPFKF